MHIDELVEHWTILEEERDLIAGKRGAIRLAFALLLKYYTQHHRRPPHQHGLRSRRRMPARHCRRALPVTTTDIYDGASPGVARFDAS